MCSVPSLTLVLPAFNEQENLDEAVQQARLHLDVISPSWEIVVVNDGSTDRTAVLAEALSTQDPRVRVVHLARNSGLGGALRAGFATARGEVIVYCDSDLPFEMEALERAYILLNDTGADMVTGYRTNRASEGLRRHLYSAVYNGLVRRLFGLTVRDVNFSLKMFRRDVGMRIGLASQGSFIDVELLARAQAAGCRFAQLGVVYTPRVRGVSTLARPSVIIGILRELNKYRQGHLVPDGPLLVDVAAGTGDSLPGADLDLHVSVPDRTEA